MSHKRVRIPPKSRKEILCEERERDRERRKRKAKDGTLEKARRSRALRKLFAEEARYRNEVTERYQHCH